MKTYLLLIILAICNSLHAQSVEPGLWKAKTSFKLNGIPLPPSEDQECISTLEAKDAKSTITKELKKDGCSLLSWKVKGSHIEASLKCKNDDMDAKGTLRGEFSAKSYALNGEAEGTYQNVLPATAILKLTGEWTKACKK